jgi:hypothetical protein
MSAERSGRCLGGSTLKRVGYNVGHLLARSRRAIRPVVRLLWCYFM